MAQIHDQILKSFLDADFFLGLSDVFGLSLYQLGQELVKSIENDGFVPYVIWEKSRYRSSPLSSCLLYLWRANLLPPEAAQTMRKALFTIRDSMPSYSNRALRAKQPEDKFAWCISEGASVWSTSMALLALIESRTESNKHEDKLILQGVSWLIKQQESSCGGWPFQKTNNSAPTVPMTAVSLQALSKIFVTLKLNKKSSTALLSSLNAGFNYLHSKIIEEPKKAYWLFDDKPSLTATVWSLQAFQSAPKLINDDLPLDKIQYFAYTIIPPSSTEWKSECFVKEPVTKYAHQKTFYTFMPSLIPPLLTMGISPLSRKIIGIIRQLVSGGRNHWRIKEYHMQPCTFTHAMALYTLTEWCRLMQNSISSSFFTFTNTKHSKSICPIYHINPPKCPAKKLIYRMLIFLIFMIFLLIALSLNVPEIKDAVKVSYQIILQYLRNSWVITLAGGVLTSLIATIIYQRFRNSKQ